MVLAKGDSAIDFVAYDTDNNKVQLFDNLTKTTVLAFFPAAFTGVCESELCHFQNDLAKLSDLNSQVIAVSVDGPFSLKAFKDKNNLDFPVLSDYNREIVTKYGITHENFIGMTGYTAAKRSVFVIDQNKLIQYVWISDDPGVEPNYDEISTAIKNLS